MTPYNPTTPSSNASAAKPPTSQAEERCIYADVELSILSRMLRTSNVTILESISWMVAASAGSVDRSDCDVRTTRDIYVLGFWLNGTYSAGQISESSEPSRMSSTIPMICLDRKRVV